MWEVPQIVRIAHRETDTCFVLFACAFVCFKFGTIAGKRWRELVFALTVGLRCLSNTKLAALNRGRGGA